MIMAEMAAFDNVKELTEMADDLATFVQRAVVEGTAVHQDAWTWTEMPPLPEDESAGRWLLLVSCHARRAEWACGR